MYNINFIHNIGDFIYKEDNVFNWIIELEKIPIGSITVIRKDFNNRVCEIGYNIGRKYWNKG